MLLGRREGSANIFSLISNALKYKQHYCEFLTQHITSFHLLSCGDARCTKTYWQLKQTYILRAAFHHSKRWLCAGFVYVRDEARKSSRVHTQEQVGVCLWNRHNLRLFALTHLHNSLPICACIGSPLLTFEFWFISSRERALFESRIPQFSETSSRALWVCQIFKLKTHKITSPNFIWSGKGVRG